MYVVASQGQQYEVFNTILKLNHDGCATQKAVRATFKLLCQQDALACITPSIPRRLLLRPHSYTQPVKQASVLPVAIVHYNFR